MNAYERLNELIVQVCSEEEQEVKDIFDMPQRDNSNLIFLALNLRRII